MKLLVDHSQRYAKMRAHTATHLLHFALDHLLQGTKQAWSLVDADYLRFDFAAKQPLSSEQLKQIEHHVNMRIYDSYAVSIQEMSFAEAKEFGAKAFFEDKYGDTVRVVQIVNHHAPHTVWHDGPIPALHSVELCWGTHVTTTNEIGAFKIIGQEAVASWIRRLIAVTGPHVATYAGEQELARETLAKMLDAQPKQVSEKLEKVLKEHETLKQQFESLQTWLIRQELQTLTTTHNNQHVDLSVDISTTPLSSYSFKEIVQQAKSLFSDKNRLLYLPDGTYALGTKSWTSAKELAQMLWVKWGWSETLVQGKDEKVVPAMSN